MTAQPKETDISKPRFREIVDALKSQIADGGLPEHAALPSERAVADLFGVSRMTARRALDALGAEGLVYSRDRSGRFVSPKRLSYNLGSMQNFVEDAADQGIAIDIEVIGTERIKAAGVLATQLDVADGMFLSRTTRLFRRDGHATFLETETVVTERAVRLLPGDVDRDSNPRFSPFGHTADIVIRMRALEEREADQLGLMPYQPGIEQEQISRDHSGQAFCVTRQIWRGELAEFKARAMLHL